MPPWRTTYARTETRMTTDWIDFAEVRRRVSLEDVLLRFYGLESRLKRQGHKLVGACPIHNGDSPRAFHADLAKNAWFCFSQCKRGGNQIDLVAAKESITVREAAIRLRDAFFGDAAPGARSAPATSPPARPLAPDAPERTPLPSAAKHDDAPAVNPAIDVCLTLQADHPHLLTERGLSLETVKHFGAGYCQRGILRGMIAIPIHDEDGDLVAYAGRRLKWADVREHGKYRLPTGFRKDLVLYNLDRAKPLSGEHGLVLVEGFFAVMALFERGVPNAVAAMGSTLSDAQADLLAETASHVTILFDGDTSGRGGAREAQALLDRREVATTLVTLPDELSPDDLPPRLLRWAVQGARLLGLRELTFSLPPKPAAP